MTTAVYWALFALAALMVVVGVQAERRASRWHRRRMTVVAARIDRIGEDVAWRHYRDRGYQRALQLRRERFAPVILRQELAKFQARKEASDLERIVSVVQAQFALVEPGFSMRVPPLHAVRDDAS